VEGSPEGSFPDKTLHPPLLEHRYTMVRCVAAALLGTLAVTSAYVPTLPTAALRSEYPTSAICTIAAMGHGHAGCADRGRALQAHSAARAADAVCCSFLIGLLCCFGLLCASLQMPSRAESHPSRPTVTTIFSQKNLLPPVLFGSEGTVWFRDSDHAPKLAFVFLTRYLDPWSRW